MEDIKEVALRVARELDETNVTDCGEHGVVVTLMADEFAEVVRKTIAEVQKAAQPVAWATFADSGNIRMWSRASEPAQKLAEQEGLSLVPLYHQPKAATVPQGWKLIAVNPAFDDLMYWMNRCDYKGHLENCSDLIEPWEQFDYRVIEAATSLPAAEDARPALLPPDSDPMVLELARDAARYRQIIEQLWNIIDDIDTAGDMFKSDDAAYREYVEAKQKCRWGTGITTDGYALNIDAAMSQDSKGEGK